MDPYRVPESLAQSADAGGGNHPPPQRRRPYAVACALAVLSMTISMGLYETVIAGWVARTSLPRRYARYEVEVEWLPVSWIPSGSWQIAIVLGIATAVFLIATHVLPSPKARS